MHSLSKVSFLPAYPLLVFLALWAPPAKPLPDEQEVIRNVDRAELERETKLPGYTVTEQYTIRNSHFDAPAEMTVETTYIRGAGKSYKVVSRSGPGFLQTHVMDKMLQAEKEMSAGEERQRAIVTSSNYRMRLVGAETSDGRAAYLLEIVPRVKSPHLIKGSLWVDAADGAVIRIQGEAAASPAFLAGRPTIDRQYEKQQGFSLARVSHAVSSSFLLGKTEVTIEYHDYHITA